MRSVSISVAACRQSSCRSSGLSLFGRIRRFATDNKNNNSEQLDETIEEQSDEIKSIENPALARFCTFSSSSLPSRNFAIPNQPFPLNPFFRPPSPLNDDTRTKMYNLFCSNESVWTPRRIAEVFGVSIDRVKAILRLKALQESFEKQGKPLQNHLSTCMEKLLGSRGIDLQQSKTKSVSESESDATEIVYKPSKNPIEPLRYTFGSAVKPFLLMMDDDAESLTPQDAAKLLRKSPYSGAANKLDFRSGDSKFWDDTKDVATKKENAIRPPTDSGFIRILSQDARVAGSCRFMIVDSSDAKLSQKGSLGESNVYVREADGQLRLANAVERWERRYGKPRKFQI